MKSFFIRKKQLLFKSLKISAGIFAGGFLLFLLLDFIFPFRFALSYSQTVTDRDGKILTAFLNNTDKWRLFLQQKEISPLMRKMILAKEDRYFYYHPGINPFAIFRAAFNNLTAGKITSGASTLSMQTVRLLEPAERTFSSKFREMFRALQLEWHYDKDEILRLYLNLVPYGGNAEGVKSAALLFFGRSPAQLSPAQAVTLAVVPNRPNTLALGRKNEAVREARDKWLRRFEEEGVLSAQTVRDALAEPLRAFRRPVPVPAKHLAERMRREFPAETEIQTTLSLDNQLKAEKITAGYMQSLRHYGILNAAVLVAENATGEVLAYVGSQDFFDASAAGQVDGIPALRSPGSALKPLIYGLAFDAGLLTPRSVISDVPIDFGGYRPENFDRKFNGNVTAKTALAYSLNVPAVKTLEQLGLPAVLDALEKADFRSIAKSRTDLGLSLALGGCGLSLYEMCGLFRAFAQKGMYSPLRLRKLNNNKGINKNDKGIYPLAKPDEKRQIISPEAAFMLSEILTDVQRPELPSDYMSNPKLPKIAWKTGTSYGRRDAWSIGFNKKYTIAVWVGNFDGKGRPEITGAGVATPLLFRLFNALDYNSDLQWFKRPAGLKSRKVCAETGLVPADFCTELLTDDFLPGLSPFEVCRHLRKVFVNQKEDISYCVNCLPETGFKQKYYPDFSPETHAYREQNGILYEKIPPHSPTCRSVAEGKPPRIVSPTDGNTYYFIGDEGAELLLQAQSGPDVGFCYWFINGRFYKKAGTEERIFFRPERGKTKISCTDDRGRNSDIFILTE